jgi:predicted metal-dependent phosphoesterase TrpH
MDIVTITDHDSIDGCVDFLSENPDTYDFFISEEVECRYPGTDLKIHIGAYDIDEAIHAEVQRLRANAIEAAAYLRSKGVFFTLNHLLFFFRNQIPIAEYFTFALEAFPGLEVRNGTMLEGHNRLVDRIVSDVVRGGRPLTAVGGSDSHSLAGIGTTYTETSGSTRGDFLAALRAGRARAGGRHGGVGRGAEEIYRVVGRYWETLVGFGRPDLSWRRRLLGLAFSAATLPFEFSPFVVAALHKRDEARRVQSACTALSNLVIDEAAAHPKPALAIPLAEDLKGRL